MPVLLLTDHIVKEVTNTCDSFVKDARDLFGEVIRASNFICFLDYLLWLHDHFISWYLLKGR